MTDTKKYIGRSLVQLRFQQKNMSQKELAKRTGVHQSTISRLESDLQAANIEQINTLAQTLGTTPEELSGYAPPTLHIENQNGGYANNYLIQHNVEIIKAKDEIIAAKDEVFASKNALIAALQMKIEQLEHKTT